MIRSPSRATNGANVRATPSMVIGPSRTTCGKAPAPVSDQLALDEFQYILGMPADLHLGEHAADRAVAVDHEGGAVDSEELPAEEALGAEDSVRVADFGVRIAQEEERQAVLEGELLVGIRAVPTDAE